MTLARDIISALTSGRLIAATGPVCDWCAAKSADPGAWWGRYAAGHLFGPFPDPGDDLDTETQCADHDLSRAHATLCPACAVIAARAHRPHCHCPAQSLAEWEAVSLLAAIDTGAAQVSPFRDPAHAFGDVDYSAHGGGFDGWRIRVFKDGYGVSWDYPALITSADGRELEPWAYVPYPQKGERSCFDCCGMVRNWSPSDTVLRGAYGMRDT